MSRGTTAPILIPTAAAPSNGDAIRVEDFDSMWVQFAHGTTSSGTAQIQGTIDGINWFNVGAAFSGGTSATLEVSPKKLSKLRVQKTADFDKDDASITLGAFDAND